jgi:Na+/H+ antiporter NhaC
MLTLVPSSVKVIFAPGITAPEESVTTPVSWAVYVDCALAVVTTFVLVRKILKMTASPQVRLRLEKSIPHPLGA